MPRARRIEYHGALYHCEASGRAGRPIIRTDEDRRMFESFLAATAQRTGWRIYAWVLLDHRYHLVFRTPEPNLVAGMRWLQNTWTKYFNSRHRLQGSVFSGRYRCDLVVDPERLNQLIDALHLFPFREGLTSPETGLGRYPWSSLRDYLLPRPKRREWTAAARGLRRMGYTSSRDSRIRYLDHLENLAKSINPKPKPISRAFRQPFRQPTPPASFPQGSHGPFAALEILKTGLRLERLSREALENLRKSDWRKRVIGRVIRLHTTVPVEWIAANLHMGISSRTARLIAEPPHPGWGREWKRASALMLDLERSLLSPEAGKSDAL